MKVAHLHWNVSKCLNNASFAINNSTLYPKTFFYKLINELFIVIGIFTLNVFTGDYLTTKHIFKNKGTQPIGSSSKESSIGYDCDSVRANTSQIWLIRIQLFLNPWDTFFVVKWKLFESLFPFKIFMKEFFRKLVWSSRRWKTVFTITAIITLYSSSFTVLFYIKIFTLWTRFTTFLQPILKKPSFTPIVSKFAKVFSNPFF